MKSSTVVRWLLVASLLGALVLSFSMLSLVVVTTASSDNEAIDLSAMASGRSKQHLRSPFQLVVKDEELPYLPSIWSRNNSVPSLVSLVRQQLEPQEIKRAQKLCGKFLYSTLARAVTVLPDGSTFVATGDIDFMWTRDSAVQMGLYTHRTIDSKDYWLKMLVEGAIRRQAFNILQDVYGNAYYRTWKNPLPLPIQDRAIGRGGWVATRNYEVDSGAYFLNQIYDYYYYHNNRRTSSQSSSELNLLNEPAIRDAVELLVDTYIVEQNHEEKSPYRYLELPRNGKGQKTGYTGMTWAGFRPSDDKCMYNYNVPTNVHVAGALERALILNNELWRSESLEEKMRKLLSEVEDGIAKHGIVKEDGVDIYAYEVDGLGNFLADFDDANVPSLLSMPFLGWTNYNRTVYASTRKRLLDRQTNKYFFQGEALRGMGSPHTPVGFVWPLAIAVEALTFTGNSPEEHAKFLAFQVRQSLKAACKDAAHESVNCKTGCPSLTREWFEWANALFVVLMEAALGIRCDKSGQEFYRAKLVYNKEKDGEHPHFYENKYNSDPKEPGNYQGIQAQIKYGLERRVPSF